MKKPLSLILSVFILLLARLPVTFAQAPTLVKSAFGTSGSATGTLGQPAPVGVSASTQFRLYSGFWQPGLDSDGDGIPDFVEGNGDVDGDGIPNYLDPDSDNDGLNDGWEVAHGTDPYNADSDRDGVPDGIEAGYGDTDGDGLINALDPDDDGDGIATRDEDANHNGDPTDDDTDGDGIPDYLDNANLRHTYLPLVFK